MWTEQGVYHYDRERTVFAEVRRARRWPRRLWIQIYNAYFRSRLALAFLVHDPVIRHACVSYLHHLDGSRAVLHNVRFVGPPDWTLCDACRSLSPRMVREPTAAERAEAGC